RFRRVLDRQVGCDCAVAVRNRLAWLRHDAVSFGAAADRISRQVFYNSVSGRRKQNITPEDGIATSSSDGREERSQGGPLVRGAGRSLEVVLSGSGERSDSSF